VAKREIWSRALALAAVPTCAPCVFGVALRWGRVPFGGVPGFFMAHPATTPRLLPVRLAVFSKPTWKSLSDLHDVRWKENIAHAGNSRLATSIAV
jgi:hypothetical protein